MSIDIEVSVTRTVEGFIRDDKSIVDPHQPPIKIRLMLVDKIRNMSLDTILLDEVLFEKLKNLIPIIEAEIKRVKQ